MTVTFENRILSLTKAQAQVDGEPNVVVAIQYNLVAKEGDNEVMDYRVINFDRSELSKPFTPFDDLTLATINKWIKAAEDKDVIDAMKESLKDQVEALSAPADEAVQKLPWVEDPEQESA